MNQPLPFANSAPTSVVSAAIPPVNRRRFLAATGATVLGLGVFPALAPALSAEVLPKIKIGLIGCGGRGKWIANLFQKHGGYDIVAVADYFPDKADGAGDQFKVPANRRFTRLGGYRRMLESVPELEAVVIETPPYFHPEQAAAAVDAGKHVYLAKPIAVDVPGCLTVEGAGRKATTQKRCFLIDFQTRTNKLYQEAAERIRKGELGKIISAEAAYHCGPTWDSMDKVLRDDPKNPENQLRAWGLSRVLSGDVITEQNIHAIDVACWMLDAHPLKAVGTAAHRRGFLGDCHDQFAVIYYFPDDVVVSFNSHQSGFGYDDILCRVFGMEGTVDTHYFGQVSIKTREYRNTGDVGGLYEAGAVANIATFHDSIVKGDFSNPTVQPSVRSNLATILGRMAADKPNEVVTWDKMLKKREKWTANLRPLAA